MSDSFKAVLVFLGIIALTVAFTYDWDSLGIGAPPNTNPIQHDVENFSFANYTNSGDWVRYESYGGKYEVRLTPRGSSSRMLFDRADNSWLQTSHIPIDITSNGNVELLCCDEDWDGFLDNDKYTIESYNVRFRNAGTIDATLTIRWYNITHGSEVYTWDFTAHITKP